MSSALDCVILKIILVDIYSSCHVLRNLEPDNYLRFGIWIFRDVPSWVKFHEMLQVVK
jgi:hypothetical protein